MLRACLLCLNKSVTNGSSNTTASDVLIRWTDHRWMIAMIEVGGDDNFLSALPIIMSYTLFRTFINVVQIRLMQDAVMIVVLWIWFHRGSDILAMYARCSRLPSFLQGATWKLFWMLFELHWVPLYKVVNIHRHDAHAHSRHMHLAIFRYFSFAFIFLIIEN